LIHLSRCEFVRLVRLAYQQLPVNFQKALDNVDISVEEWPGKEELELLEEEGTLFGLYTGVPLPERVGGNPGLPDRIIIYRQPILRSCATRAEVVKEIRFTLWHEVGHYLGLSEEDLHRLGYG
jgi:predicted Zn-dependent protease with MMP-like domain